MPKAGGGSGNDWLRVRNILGIPLVGIPLVILSRERPVNGITGNGITFASLHLSQSNPLLPSAIGIFFNAYVNV